MTKGNRKAAKNQMMQKLHHVERELAKVAPPKVENEEFTVVSTLTLRPDSGQAGSLPRISRVALTGNGWYDYSATSSTPNPASATNVAQVEQVDRRFAMYKYWTPLYVKLTVYPHIVDYQSNSLGTGGNTVVHRPWATIKDLDIRAERDLPSLAAKGKKPFHMYPPKAHFTESYPNLDRIALQKQQKQMFLTNGSWSTREQLRDPAGIILWSVSPTQADLASYEGFGTIVIEFRFRLSERNKPGAEMVAIPRPMSACTVESVEQKQPQQSQLERQQQLAWKLEAELAALKAS